jgi:hypothetical protein
VTTSASQIEVSKAAFVPICLKAHGGAFLVSIGRHSISYCQNSSSCTREITPYFWVHPDEER